VFEIGSTLREARVRRSLTLQQIEEDTKIRVKYVQAMENEDFDIMPGPTYVKGFLRTYSEYLGLDPEVIIGEYRSREGRTSVRVQEEPFGGVSTLGRPRSHRGRNTIVFIAVICLLVLAVIWILGRNGPDETGPSTKPGALGLTSPSPTATPSHAPTPSPSATAADVRDVVRIATKNGDCWVQVRRNGPSGVTLFSGTVKQGGSRTFKGTHLWMSLGNPVAVRLTAGGKNVKLQSDVGPWPVEIIKGRVLQGTQTQGG
jgi:cytoskeleton protein RodZ